MEDAVAAAVAADAWHYLEMLRLENDEELKALKEEERLAELEDLRNIPRLTSSHLSHFFGDPRYGLRCRLVALGHDNRVRVCGPDFQTSFVGAAFPLGYELFDKNYAFMEPENCEDLKRGMRDREVHEDDIATTHGFARVRYDDREQVMTDIGEDWWWMWPYSSRGDDARTTVHGGPKSGPGVAGEEGRCWRDVRLAGLPLISYYLTVVVWYFFHLFTSSSSRACRAWPASRATRRRPRRRRRRGA